MKTFEHRGYIVKINLKKKIAEARKKTENKCIWRVGDLALKYKLDKILRVEVSAKDVTLEELTDLIVQKINIEWLHE